MLFSQVKPGTSFTVNVPKSFTFMKLDLKYHYSLLGIVNAVNIGSGELHYFHHDQRVIVKT